MHLSLKKPLWLLVWKASGHNEQMLLDKERGKAAAKSPSSVPRAFSKDSMTITPHSLSPPSVKFVFPSNHLAFLPSILLADSSVLSIVFSSPHPSLSLRSDSGNSTGFWSQNDSNPYYLFSNFQDISSSVSPCAPDACLEWWFYQRTVSQTSVEMWQSPGDRGKCRFSRPTPIDSKQLGLNPRHPNLHFNKLPRL